MELPTRHLVIAIFILIGLGSCSTEPDFSRDNKNDPNAQNFSPDPPSGEHYQLDEEGNVSITWVDNTNFETGYLIYKSLGTNLQYELLAELDQDAISYIDTTKILAFPTIYHIVSISETNASDTLDVKLNFGTVKAFDAERIDSKIHLTWNDQVSYEDGFEIRRKPDTNNDTLFVSTVTANAQEFIFDIPNDGFQQEIFLYPFKVLNEDTTYLSKNPVVINSGGPENITVSVADSDSLFISWYNYTSFEESFRLNIVKNSSEISQYTVPKGSDSFTVYNPFDIDDTFEARLSAQYHNIESPITYSDLLNIGDITPPTIDSVVSVNETTANLHFSKDSNIQSDIEILRSENNGTYTNIGVLPKSNSVFTDSNLNPDNTYNYILKTFLTEDPEPYSIYYKPNLQLLEKKYYTDNWLHNFEYSKSQNTLIYASGVDQNQANTIYFYDLDTKRNQRVSSPAQYLKYLKINKSGNLLVAYGRQNTPDKIFIYDLNTERFTKKILTIENLDYARDIVFTPNDEALYISAQIRNPETGAISHTVLKYDLEEDSFETAFPAFGVYFYTNYSEDQLLVYTINSSSVINVSTYEFIQGDIELKNGMNFSTNFVRQNYEVVSSSANMDTVVFSSSYHDDLNEIVRLDMNSGSVINRTRIRIDNEDRSITGLYYSSNFTLAQYYDGILVIEHATDGDQIVGYYKYENSYRFKDDFMYIPEKNLLIDARSSYSNREYLESNFRMFEIENKWKQVIDIND